MITADLCEKLNPKKSLNSEQSFMNGVNKPFMGLFFIVILYDTCFDSTTEIMSNKHKRHRYYLLSHFFLFSKLYQLYEAPKTGAN